MPHIFKDGDTCVCGGTFSAINQAKDSDPPTGAFIKCGKCKRQACVPEIYQPWKQAQEKKKGGK
jgi:hypothetical protein